MSRRGQEGPDVVYHVSSPGGVFYDPPDHEGDGEPPNDRLKVHVASHGRPDSSYSSENQC